MAKTFGEGIFRLPQAGPVPPQPLVVAPAPAAIQPPPAPRQAPVATPYGACEDSETVQLPPNWRSTDRQEVNLTPEGTRIGSINEPTPNKFVWRLGQRLSTIPFNLDHHGP